MSTFSSLDITFKRAASNPGKTYRLWSDPDKHYPRNIVANVADQRTYAPWCTGKADWETDHVVGKENSGRLYNAELSYHLLPREPPARPRQAAVKWMRGERAMEALRREASMYMGPLRHIQGTVVPIFYGFFTGKVEGVDIGCIVLEWCNGNDWLTSEKPTESELLARLEGVRRLHAAGVKHGQLYDRRDALSPFDGRHFLRAADGSMRIVGFQHAKEHRCAGGLDVHDDLTVCLDDKCRELCYAEVHWQRAFGGGLGGIRWRPY